MTYASPAIGLRATKADRNPGVLTAGGVALALGSIGVTVTSVLYALSPPAAALPAYPLDLALAGARSGASILHAAGTVGIFQTSSWLSACSWSHSNWFSGNAASPRPAGSPCS
jgi:hypothetical protein